MASLRRTDRRAVSIPGRAQLGLTLVEMVISMLVVSIAVTGVLLAIVRTTRHSADPMILHQASSIAEAYLEEILLKAYTDPDSGTICPAAEGSRNLYDNVCDYAVLDDLGARTQDGVAVAGLGNYRIRVAVDTTATLNALTGIANVLRVDVRVTHDTPVDITLSGYRTSY